jgi:elongation factor 1 alpha-like protein
VRLLTAWYDGPTLLGALDAAKPPPRLVDRPLRLCVSDVYRSAAHGLTVAGRLEGGWLTPHTRILVVPGGEVATVRGITINGVSVPHAAAGDNVDVAIGGVDEGVLAPGQVLCWPSHPVREVVKFKAQLAVFGGLDMPIVPGQQFTFHAHNVEVPANVTRLLRTLDRDGHTAAVKPRCLVGNSVAVVRVRLTRPVCLDTYAEHRRLGRFLLRYSGRTVAAGMVLKVKR